MCAIFSLTALPLSPCHNPQPTRCAAIHALRVTNPLRVTRCAQHAALQPLRCLGPNRRIRTKSGMSAVASHTYPRSRKIWRKRRRRFRPETHRPQCFACEAVQPKHTKAPPALPAGRDHEIRVRTHAGAHARHAGGSDPSLTHRKPVRVRAARSCRPWRVRMAATGHRTTWITRL